MLSIMGHCVAQNGHKIGNQVVWLQLVGVDLSNQQRGHWQKYINQIRHYKSYLLAMIFHIDLSIYFTRFLSLIIIADIPR